MSPSHGKFVWYELRTSDLKASEKFYGDVVRWTAKDAGMPGMAYTLFSAGDQAVSGAVTMPGGMPPHWMGFVGVDDVDASAAKVQSLGGAVVMGPQDIPGVGRFAIFTDPQGAHLALFKWAPTDTPSGPVAPGTLGHCGWHELYAGDVKTIFDFYGELFGWTRGEAMDMGPMGTYQLFNHGEVMIGGMMTKSATMPAPAWCYYFNVESIEAAVARAKAGGGTICHGPMQVPGDDWIAQVSDPQGAMVALTSRKK